MKLIDVTPNDSIVPVYVEKLTEQEQIERDADYKASQAVAKKQEAEATARVDARASALAKLAKLGLTKAEIEAL